MLAVLFAILTAAAWGVGGYFEKKGLKLGNLSPHVGITVRTAVAILILGVISLPQWKQLGNAGTKSILYLVIGGGIVAGSIGMLCFYAAIKEAPLSRVMPIAFTAPLFGALMGMMFGGEPISMKIVIGMLLTVSGIVVLTMS
ncbi:EamA family transporter [Poriferisphaera sp. WC338]|uniref:EamA family transporter n=1 Tax=Poriferisphaera sp. WC338 TaxID=3425129 RepID=UPI003D81410B